MGQSVSIRYNSPKCSECDTKLFSWEEQRGTCDVCAGKKSFRQGGINSKVFWTIDLDAKEEIQTDVLSRAVGNETRVSETGEPPSSPFELAGIIPTEGSPEINE